MRGSDGTLCLVESGVGTYAIEGTNLVLTEDDDPVPFTVAFVLSGNALTLSVTDESFDFDDDGVEEAATLEMVLTETDPLPARRRLR